MPAESGNTERGRRGFAMVVLSMALAYSTLMRKLSANFRAMGAELQIG